ncbi:MAG: hypothetical protein H0T42_04685 [Deltaproteobacteria bacterium]|nr:hypothetical protein [Deltaproteobacteria bacterium]
MVRHPWTIATVLLLTACGGGDKKDVKKPVASKDPTVAPKKETEEERETKRIAAAHALIPDGSSCLPVALKEPGAPRLEVAAINSDLVICAIDVEPDRLLGPVACWKVDLKASPIGLVYIPAAPIPGRGISVKLDERCARGYCLPKDAKVPGDNVVHMTWHPDGAKVAVVLGDDVHLFDAASKAHEKSFPIRGEKGIAGKPTAVHWVGDVLYVEASDDTTASVWAFKTDGTAVGPIEAIGTTKPASTQGGSFSILDKSRVAVAEQGFSTMTIYEGDSGKRSKLVRKLTKPPCKADELTAYWAGNEGVGPKCKDHMAKNFDHLVGATAVAGSKSLVVTLRGPRLGELGLVDPKSLAEKSSLKLPWCGGGAATAGAEAADGSAKMADKAAAPKKAMTRGPAPKGGGGDEDPCAGGE